MMFGVKFLSLREGQMIDPSDSFNMDDSFFRISIYL